MIFAQFFLGWGNQPRPEQLFYSVAYCCSTGTSQGFPAKPCFFRNFPHFDPGPVVSWDGPSAGSPGPLPGPGGCSGVDTQKHLQAELGPALQLPPNPRCSQPGISSVVPSQGSAHARSNTPRRDGARHCRSCPSARPSAAAGAQGSAGGVEHSKRRPRQHARQGCSYLRDGRGQREVDEPLTTFLNARSLPWGGLNEKCKGKLVSEFRPRKGAWSLATADVGTNPPAPWPLQLA